MIHRKKPEEKLKRIAEIEVFQSHIVFTVKKNRSRNDHDLGGVGKCRPRSNDYGLNKKLTLISYTFED